MIEFEYMKITFNTIKTQFWINWSNDRFVGSIVDFKHILCQKRYRI